MQQCSSVPVVQWRLLCRDCRGWCSAQCPPRRHTKGTHDCTLLDTVTEIVNLIISVENFKNGRHVREPVLFVTFRL